MITSQTRQSLHRFIVAHATSEIARYAISCINNIQSSILPHLLWCDSLPCDKITGKGSVFMDKLIGHIPWIISLISVIISWKSLKSAENIAHFNAYFSCKSTAYSNLIEQICIFCMSDTSPVEPLMNAVYQASVYGSPNVRAALRVASSQLQRQPSSLNIEDLFRALQEDLDAIAKFHQWPVLSGLESRIQRLLHR